MRGALPALPTCLICPSMNRIAATPVHQNVAYVPRLEVSILFLIGSTFSVPAQVRLFLWYYHPSVTALFCCTNYQEAEIPKRLPYLSRLSSPLAYCLCETAHAPLYRPTHSCEFLSRSQGHLVGALYYLKLSIYPTGFRRQDKLRQISLAALSRYRDLRSPVVVNLAYSHEQSRRRSGYRSNRTGFPVSCLVAILRWPVSMSPNLSFGEQGRNEVEGGSYTPSAPLQPRQHD